MALSKKQAMPDRLPRQASPIRYLTENGFTIVRLSEINPSVIDAPGECRFLVQRENEAEHEVKASFAGELIANLQIRRRLPLSSTSVFWLVCAESYLANYLWDKDGLPPNDRLIISELSPDELMLALHWRDRD
jgi:hypothetical protein